jgi:hypothetical protein
VVNVPSHPTLPDHYWIVSASLCESFDGDVVSYVNWLVPNKLRPIIVFSIGIAVHSLNVAIFR